MSESPSLVEIDSPTELHIEWSDSWFVDPALWFAKTEAVFTARQIVDQHLRFAHVVSVIPMNVGQEIRDIIVSPSTDHPYDLLKSHLIQLAPKIRQNYLSQLIHSEKLGDKKPSKYLEDLKLKLACALINLEIPAKLFVEQLPVHIQSFVEPLSQKLSLDDLALVADRLLEQHDRPVHSVDSGAHLEMDRMKEEIQLLQKRISEISRDSVRPHTPRIDNKNIKICWYHRHFGGKSLKCSNSCILTPMGVFRPANMQ
ncbi:unnamed protein product [Calicophoron daubneyi]|uniref:DUF7041 domain-containing protein n=1 Tax=Calicophoron daubneyi TaxID=300641 RepID=A0AAV2TGF8_CALDB